MYVISNKSFVIMSCKSYRHVDTHINNRMWFLSLLWDTSCIFWKHFKPICVIRNVQYFLSEFIWVAVQKCVNLDYRVPVIYKALVSHVASLFLLYSNRKSTMNILYITTFRFVLHITFCFEHFFRWKVLILYKVLSNITTYIKIIILYICIPHKGKLFIITLLQNWERNCQLYLLLISYSFLLTYWRAYYLIFLKTYNNLTYVYGINTSSSRVTEICTVLE